MVMLGQNAPDFLILDTVSGTVYPRYYLPDRVLSGAARSDTGLPFSDHGGEGNFFMAVTRFKAVSALILLILFLAGGYALYLWAALTWSYSRGERAGYIQKFSEKGWVIKTWEGELAMVPLPGALPEKFPFSARSDSVARSINSSLGKRVVITYEQHKGLPRGLFGETEYFVVAVKTAE